MLYTSYGVLRPWCSDQRLLKPDCQTEDFGTDKKTESALYLPLVQLVAQVMALRESRSAAKCFCCLQALPSCCLDLSWSQASAVNPSIPLCVDAECHLYPGDRYDLGLIGGAMLSIQDEIPGVTEAAVELIVAGAKIGAFFGTFLGGGLMLYYGRRTTIAMDSVFFMLGPIIMASASGVSCVPFVLACFVQFLSCRDPGQRQQSFPQALYPSETLLQLMLILSAKPGEPSDMSYCLCLPGSRGSRCFSSCVQFEEKVACSCSKCCMWPASQLAQKSSMPCSLLS